MRRQKKAWRRRKPKLPRYAKIVWIHGRPCITFDYALYMNDVVDQASVNSSWVSLVKGIIPALQRSVEKLEPLVEKKQPWW